MRSCKNKLENELRKLQRNVPVAKTVQGPAEFELLPPFARGLSPEHTARFKGGCALLTSTFPTNDEQIKQSVYRGRKPDGSKPDCSPSAEACLLAGIWLDSKIVCAASLRLNLPKAKAFPEHVQIVYQATAARYQNHGLGRLLTRCILRAAAEAGHEYATVVVMGKEVEGYWHKMGFRPSSSKDVHAVRRAVDASKEHAGKSAVWLTSLAPPQPQQQRPEDAGQEEDDAARQMKRVQYFKRMVGEAVDKMRLRFKEDSKLGAAAPGSRQPAGAGARSQELPAASSGALADAAARAGSQALDVPSAAASTSVSEASAPSKPASTESPPRSSAPKAAAAVAGAAAAAAAAAAAVAPSEGQPAAAPQAVPVFVVFGDEDEDGDDGEVAAAYSVEAPAASGGQRVRPAGGAAVDATAAAAAAAPQRTAAGAASAERRLELNSAPVEPRLPAKRPRVAKAEKATSPAHGTGKRAKKPRRSSNAAAAQAQTAAGVPEPCVGAGAGESGGAKAMGGGDVEAGCKAAAAAAAAAVHMVSVVNPPKKAKPAEAGQLLGAPALSEAAPCKPTKPGKAKKVRKIKARADGSSGPSAVPGLPLAAPAEGARQPRPAAAADAAASLGQEAAPGPFITPPVPLAGCAARPTVGEGEPPPSQGAPPPTQSVPHSAAPQPPAGLPPAFASVWKAEMGAVEFSARALYQALARQLEGARMARERAVAAAAATARLCSKRGRGTGDGAAGQAARAGACSCAHCRAAAAAAAAAALAYFDQLKADAQAAFDKVGVEVDLFPRMRESMRKLAAAPAAAVEATTTPAAGGSIAPANPAPSVPQPPAWLAGPALSAPGTKAAATAVPAATAQPTAAGPSAAAGPGTAAAAAGSFAAPPQLSPPGLNYGEQPPACGAGSGGAPGPLHVSEGTGGGSVAPCAAGPPPPEALTAAPAASPPPDQAAGASPQAAAGERLGSPATARPSRPRDAAPRWGPLPSAPPPDEGQTLAKGLAAPTGARDTSPVKAASNATLGASASGSRKPCEEPRRGAVSGPSAADVPGGSAPAQASTAQGQPAGAATPAGMSHDMTRKLVDAARAAAAGISLRPPVQNLHLRQHLSRGQGPGFGAQPRGPLPAAPSRPSERGPARPAAGPGAPPGREPCAPRPATDTARRGSPPLRRGRTASPPIRRIRPSPSPPMRRIRPSPSPPVRRIRRSPSPPPRLVGRLMRPGRSPVSRARRSASPPGRWTRRSPSPARHRAPSAAPHSQAQPCRPQAQAQPCRPQVQAQLGAQEPRRAPEALRPLAAAAAASAVCSEAPCVKPPPSLRDAFGGGTQAADAPRAPAYPAEPGARHPLAAGTSGVCREGGEAGRLPSPRAGEFGAAATCSDSQRQQAGTDDQPHKRPRLDGSVSVRPPEQQRRQQEGSQYPQEQGPCQQGGVVQALKQEPVQQLGRGDWGGQHAVQALKQEPVEAQAQQPAQQLGRDGDGATGEQGALRPGPASRQACEGLALSAQNKSGCRLAEDLRRQDQGANPPVFVWSEPGQRQEPPRQEPPRQQFGHSTPPAPHHDHQQPHHNHQQPQQQDRTQQPRPDSSCPQRGQDPRERPGQWPECEPGRCAAGSAPQPDRPRGPSPEPRRRSPSRDRSRPDRGPPPPPHGRDRGEADGDGQWRLSPAPPSPPRDTAAARGAWGAGAAPGWRGEGRDGVDRSAPSGGEPEPWRLSPARSPGGVGSRPGGEVYMDGGHFPASGAGAAAFDGMAQDEAQQRQRLPPHLHPAAWESPPPWRDGSGSGSGGGGGGADWGLLPPPPLVQAGQLPAQRFQPRGPPRHDQYQRYHSPHGHGRGRGQGWDQGQGRGQAAFPQQQQQGAPHGSRAHGSFQSVVPGRPHSELQPPQWPALQPPGAAQAVGNNLQGIEVEVLGRNFVWPLGHGELQPPGAAPQAVGDHLMGMGAGPTDCRM